MTILSTLFQLILLPMIGIYQGAQPIVSFCYGAGLPGRVRSAIFLAGTAIFIWAFSLSGLMTLFPIFFCSIFTSNPAILNISASLLKIYISGCFFLGLLIVSQESFTALNSGKIAFFFAFLRKGALLIPLIYIFPHILGENIDSVIAAEPVSDIITSLASFLYFISWIKNKLKMDIKQNSQ